MVHQVLQILVTVFMTNIFMNTKTISEETPEILNTVSEFIRGYRILSGLSQESLSKMSGIHANTIHHIETGCSYNISSLIAVALALDLPLRELFWEL